MSARSMVLAIKPSCFRTQRRVKGHRFFIVSLLNHCSDKLKAHHENHWSTCEHSHWTEGTWFLNGNPTQRNKTVSTLETSLGHLRLISSWNWQRWIAIPFLSYACFLLKSFNIIQHLQVSFSVNLFREKKPMTLFRFSITPATTRYYFRVSPELTLSRRKSSFQLSCSIPKR